MLIINGKASSKGIAFGKAVFCEHEIFPIYDNEAPDSDFQRERVRRAIEIAHSQLDEMYFAAISKVGDEDAQIFEIHKMLIDDSDFTETLFGYIDDGCSAEYAVECVCRDFVVMLDSVEDEYMRERAADVRDICDRLMHNLAGLEYKKMGTEFGSIVFTNELYPSDAIRLDKNKVRAICTVSGSVHSHSAILARNMNIPFITQTYTEIDRIHSGVEVIADGYDGVVYIDPDEETRKLMLEKQNRSAGREKIIERLDGRENITKDGVHVMAMADIAKPDETDFVIAYGADGVGLFRSDFLFDEGYIPSEEEQYMCYSHILERMKGRFVVVRISDKAAQKTIRRKTVEDKLYSKDPRDIDSLNKNKKTNYDYRQESAPEIEFVNEEMLKTQLRALFRASVYGRLGILFPIIDSPEEMDTIRKVLYEVGGELMEQNIKFRDNIRIGTSIDTPAASVMSDIAAKEADFFVVDIEALASNTVAADRQSISEWAENPAMMTATVRMAAITLKNGRDHHLLNIVCNVPTDNDELCRMLVYFGADALSCPAEKLIDMRQIILNMDVEMK